MYRHFFWCFWAVCFLLAAAALLALGAERLRRFYRRNAELQRLFLSVHTVNTHRQRIYAKLDVRNVSDMIRKATDLGIL